MRGLLDRLERLESQQRLTATDLTQAERDGLAAVGGCNLAILRIVSRLEGSC